MDNEVDTEGYTGGDMEMDAYICYCQHCGAIIEKPPNWTAEQFEDWGSDLTTPKLCDMCDVE